MAFALGAVTHKCLVLRCLSINCPALFDYSEGRTLQVLRPMDVTDIRSLFFATTPEDGCCKLQAQASLFLLLMFSSSCRG